MRSSVEEISTFRRLLAAVPIHTPGWQTVIQLTCWIDHEHTDRALSPELWCTQIHCVEPPNRLQDKPGHALILLQ